MSIEEIYTEFLASDGISIDSRTIRPNQIFFALGGTKEEGSKYAGDALKKGARLAVVTHSGHAGEHCIGVESALSTLQQLATKHRDTLKIPVLGITGSVGKTTTKELIHSVLSRQYKSYCTTGNLNNHIGVPLTVLGIGGDVEIAIIEMGANHIGEIETLCAIAKPTHGLITKIGKAHLEGFGSLEGVIIAKSDLFRFLQNNHGVAFINDEDSLLLSVSKGFSMEKKYIHDSVNAELIDAAPFLRLRVSLAHEEALINTQIPGKYNQQNVEAALCIGHYFKVPLDKMKQGIESYESKSNRSQLFPYRGNNFILDAYNANPVSMEAAIKSFAELVTSEKKILILGEMKELGEESLSSHQEIIELLSDYTWERVILVGKQFADPGKKSDFLYFEDVTTLASWFEKQSFKDTIFLVKGSRGVALEKIFKGDLVNPGSSH